MDYCVRLSKPIHLKQQTSEESPPASSVFAASDGNRGEDTQPSHMSYAEALTKQDGLRRKSIEAAYRSRGATTALFGTRRTHSRHAKDCSAGRVGGGRGVPGGTGTRVSLAEVNT